MGRRRKAITIEGQSIVPDAPGLESRHDGRSYYWIASTEARRRKFHPVMVRVHGPITTLEQLRAVEQRCHALTNEMLEWLGNPDASEQIIYNGTLKSLSQCYQRDPRSPFRGLRLNTRRTYIDSCRTIEKMFGARRVDKLTGQDIREMFDQVMQPTKPGGRPRVRHAKAAIRQMLPILLTYGVEAKLPGCYALLQVMDRMTLRVPATTRKAYRLMLPKKVPMGYTHARDIVAEGLRRYQATGMKRWRSVALGIAAQFEFTLRQIDVIGEFEPITPSTIVSASAIVRHRKIWSRGLTYESFANGVLDIVTSKNDTEAPFDPAEYPLFVQALSTVPAEERHGPVVVDEDGRPMFKRFYGELYRQLADAVGVPKEVWNMRARHGGLTEGYNAIVEENQEASLADLRYHGQHADLNTTLGSYVVGGVAATRRVARRRVALRQKKESA